MAIENENTHSGGLKELLGRALIDPQLKERLFQEPEAVANQYNLSPGDCASLLKLDRAKVEEASGQLAGRADWRISVAIKGTFSSDGDPEPA